MKIVPNTYKYLPLLILVLLSLLLTACPKKVDEAIRERTRVTPLGEATHARDIALDTAVQRNIMSDTELEWYARTYGITVEV